MNPYAYRFVGHRLESAGFSYLEVASPDSKIFPRTTIWNYFRSMDIQVLRSQLEANRKKFTVARHTGSFSPAPNRQIRAGLEPYSGVWSRREAAHLARRVFFGATKEEIDHIHASGMETAVAEVLNITGSAPPPINNYNDVGYTDPRVPFGQTWIHDKSEDVDLTSRRVISLKTWMIDRIIEQESTIEEKMIFFWHNHLVTEAWGVFWPNLSYRQIELFRKHALGDFRQLIHEITIDPAMLIYLNGVSNNKEAPDENYARELQELFCIGKGPNAAFTEDDVKAAARVLTGWSINWETGQQVFHSWAHDSGNKQFSGFYQNRLIQGRSGSAGQDELAEMLDMIFGQPECALFICRKIYRFFVYPEIDESTELNVIGPMAQILRDNGFRIKPVLEALFNSQHFYADENIGACIKSPLDFLPGFWRSMHVRYPATDLTSKAHVQSSLLWSMSNIGLEMLDPPNVAGFPAYYQVPQFDKYWITTDTIPTRAIHTDSFIWWGFWSESVLTNVDVLGYVSSLENNAEPELLIDEITENLLSVPLSAKGRNALRSILLSGQMSDHYWTDAWLNYLNDPGNEVFRNIVEVRLKNFFQRLFQMSEYHLT